MIKYRRILFFCFVSYFAVCLSANASSIRQLGMNDMLAAAELVFEGQVTNSEARWNDDKTLIQTFITFTVSEVISGDYAQDSLELSFVGGRVGIDAMQAEGSRHPKVGEKGIYFIESVSKQLVNPLVGWSQGHFLLKKNESGDEYVMTDKNAHVMSIASESISSNSRTLSSTSSLSSGVARNVIVDKQPSSKGMSALKFKQELKQLRIKLNNQTKQ